MHRVDLVIRGRVQGVGFRYFVLRRAQRLGLCGWVRNRDDGAVEVEATGARDTLGILIAALREGPTGSVVTEINESWSEGGTPQAGFRIVG
jgi:acylphosphatase